MVTMKDIARFSGYSRATVSAVLGNKPGVSAKTRERILKVVDEHHYAPNRMATALVGKSSNLVGVVARDLTNPYYMQLATGIERVLSAEGFTILYFNTREDHDREVEALRNLSAYQVAGVVFAPILKGVNLEHVWIYNQRNKRPFITMEQIPGFGLDYVGFRDEDGGRLATRHLLEHGHRRICYLAGPPTAMSSEQRAIGFRLAFADYGLRSDETYIVPCGATSREGYESAMQVLADAVNRPTAIFCFSDLVAIGVYKAAHNLGLSIPGDISIIGYDDIDIADLLGPPLTTISYSMEKVGEFVAQSLVQQIRQKTAQEGLAKVFEPRLVQRQSVRRIDA